MDGLSRRADRKPPGKEGVLALRLFAAFFDVKRMHDAVDERRKEDAQDADEDQAGEQCVGGGEQLGRWGGQCIHWPHSGQDHCGVEKGVDPSQLCDEVIAGDSHDQRAGYGKQGKPDMPKNALSEGDRGEEPLAAMFVHVMTIAKNRNNRGQTTFSNNRGQTTFYVRSWTGTWTTDCVRRPPVATLLGSGRFQSQIAKALGL